MTDNEKVNYEIVMVDDFSDVELAMLGEYSKMNNIEEFSFEPDGLTFTVHMDRSKDIRKDFAYIASWMSRIGADHDIYCIRKVETYYTGYTSPEVKELMRTDA